MDLFPAERLPGVLLEEGQDLVFLGLGLGFAGLQGGAGLVIGVVIRQGHGDYSLMLLAEKPKAVRFC